MATGRLSAPRKRASAEAKRIAPIGGALRWRLLAGTALGLLLLVGWSAAAGAEAEFVARFLEIAALEFDEDIVVGAERRGDVEPRGDVRVHVVEGAVDMRHLAVDPEPFGAAEEIAVHPVARDREPFERGELGAEAEAARFLVGERKFDIHRVAGPEGLGLGDRDRGESAGAPEPVGRFLDLGGRIGLAGGQARDHLHPLGAHRGRRGLH